MKLLQSISLKRWVIVLTGLLLILLSACSNDSDLKKRQDELEQSVTDLQATNTGLQATLETLSTAQGTPVPGPFPTPIDEIIIVAETV